ncbi:MAG: 50S ribosomal protein L29 [Patescibacteria group bacterium]
MPNSKFKDLLNLNKTELTNKLSEARQELTILKSRIARQDLKDVRAVRKVRQQVAQLLTLISKNK